jgi:hypothetical protein
MTGYGHDKGFSAFASSPTSLQILHFSILLHCIVQWILKVMFPSAYSFILCWFSLSFTTCFGLHGHLQVCRILHIFIYLCLRILLRCVLLHFWFAAFSYVVTLCMFSICGLFLFSFPSCSFFLVFSACCLLWLFVCPYRCLSESVVLFPVFI